MIDTVAIRKRILELAFTGKLVEQNSNDEKAEFLVKRITKQLNGTDTISEISPEEYPYEELPEGWCWCRLSDIGTTNIGLTYHPEDVVNDGIIVLRSNNIKDNKMTYSDVIKVNCSVRDNQYIDKNDILVCARNGSKALVGKCALYDGKFGKISFGAFMAIFRTELSKYVYYYFTSQLFRRYFSSDDTKQINQVTQSILKNSVIPIPPLEEQIRITDGLDEAFNMLDRLEGLQQQYSSDLEVLKSKIIDAGIQGKLTEQLPEDGTAEELLEQIVEEKMQLINEKKIKATKALPEIAEDEIPFEIPIHWKWVRWGELSNSIQYGYNAPAKKEGRIKMVRISDIQDGKVLWDTVPYCDIDEVEIGSYLLHENDILFARTGGTVGKSYIVTDVPEESVFAGYLIRTSYSSKLCARYMKYFMESKLYWRQLQNGTIATAQPNCNGQTLSKMILPLPPYAEQVRIVDKIDSVLSLIQ